MKQFKTIICILVCIVWSTQDSYGGFLSYWSPRNTIFVSNGKILENNEFITDAELTVGILEDIMEVSLYYNGEIQISISIPLKYVSVTTKEIYYDDISYTSYLVRYGYFQLTYANMRNYQVFLIDTNQGRIQFNGINTKYYNDSWEAIKDNNGSEYRNSDDIEMYFHGLYMDKVMGLY